MNSHEKCTICSMTFASMTDLQNHVSGHVSTFLDSFKIYKCHHCEEKFVNPILRNLHIEKVHKFKCQHCEKTLWKNKYLLKEHECKIYVKIWQSSHGRESRYLPSFVQESFANQGRFFIPEIDAVPGRKIDFDLINTMTKFAIQKSQSVKKQLHFFCIGDNNLRWNKDSLETFMFKIQHLVNQFSSVQNCHLVLTSILPQPVSDKTSKTVFRSANHAMYALCKNHQNVSFMDITKSFVKDNVIDASLFQRDGVHMTESGAKKMQLASRDMQCF